MSPRPLLLLAVLLGGLLALKALSLADGASAFFAERAFAAAPEAADDEAADPDDGAATAEDESDAPAGPAATPPALDRRAAPMQMPTASQLGLETDLARRRQELDRREDALDTREQLLAVAEARYDERLAELETVRSEIQDLLGQLDDQRQRRIDSIVSTYAQLEPDAAAPILQAMDDTDPETLLMVARQLQETNPRRFAAVMAEMEPGFAAGLTSRLRATADPQPSRAEAEARNAVAGEG
ncbi:MAG: hypothetical protein ABL308_09025 [Oceanicaulis sp.]